ncbi:2-phosphosulfolactate phosphatase [Salicibibacter kimchii]
MSLEDYVCASIILSRLNMENVRLNDAAVFALEHNYDNKETIGDILAKGRVGRNFMKLGLDELFDFVIDVGLSTSVVELYEDGSLNFMHEGSETTK